MSLLTALWPATALAVTSPATTKAAVGEHELANGHVLHLAAPHEFRATAADPARARAFDALTAELGSAWATWDDQQEHPRQIIAAGLATPGVIASPDEAERVARDLLRRHVALLAPGSSDTDFVLVSNDESAGIRSVGFAQHAGGREVVGGQIGLLFKHDRLVMITSLAKSNVFVSSTLAPADETTVRAQARSWIARDFSPATLRSDTAVSAPMILPVDDGTGSGPQYREVVRTEVRTETPMGRWWVYLDAETGEPVARQSTMHEASGQIIYNASSRSPIFPRVNLPVPSTNVLVNGELQTTDLSSSVTFPGSAANVSPGLQGPFAEIVDETGPLLTDTLFLADGGVAVWNQGDEEAGDAQATTYAHLLAVKSYVRAFAPDLEWLNRSTTATVNIDDECNAMSDGDSLFFLRSSNNCENTGRMADVIYHEAGHSVHRQSLIPGVGSFDGALSEGISDYLAATIVGDSGMGRGFFYDEEPLRELNPVGFERVWPEDDGEIHQAGMIIGGALWDLRTLLMEKYGPAEGIRRTDIIFYEGTRRAVDMPSMYGAALLVNDDDGNLANGTPDGCEINQAFGSHGLFSGTGIEAEKVVAQEVPGGLGVRVDLNLPSFDACPLEAVAFIEWGPRDGDSSTQLAEMTPVGGGYELVLPPLPDGQVMRYRVLVEYSTGAARIVPPNQGDPWFQHWFGPVEPIYCTSFDQALADGWEITNPWDVDVPLGLAGDPADAAGPDPFVLGLDLNGDGFYPPGSNTSVLSPVIAVPAGYASVRLHYQRWLTVEDGFYDQAFITANEEIAWSNFASANDNQGANVHHRDSQWVFHDVDISAAASGGQVQLGFGVRTDGGLEMGGWTVDELCVVGYRPGANACGNGVIEGTEECDDGNLLDGDGCSAVCLLEGDDGGDDGSDDGGSDDGGSDDGGGAGGGLTNDGLVPRGCACQATDDAPGSGFAAFGLLVLLGLRRRRR
ncbi:MAG: myxococcus cysteine-rich repeat containing protein [Myxococcota bacterium]